MHDLIADSNPFICATCGERHERFPGLSFDAPFHYRRLAPERQASSAFLNADICSIDNEDFFVRGCLEIPIHGQREPFVWGVWTSLSRRNFDRYIESFGKVTHEQGPYFGWLCSRLPGYVDTLHLKTDVYFRVGDLRPRINVEPTEHPLAVDQHTGMSRDALLRVVEANLHHTGATARPIRG